MRRNDSVRSVKQWEFFSYSCRNITTSNKVNLLLFPIDAVCAVVVVDVMAAVIAGLFCLVLIRSSTPFSLLLTTRVSASYSSAMLQQFEMKCYTTVSRISAALRYNCKRVIHG